MVLQSRFQENCLILQPSPSVVMPITTFKTPDIAMAPASLGVCPEMLKVQNQMTDVGSKSRNSKEGKPCNHSLSITQVGAKGPPLRLTLTLMSGANSRELSGPESSRRQDSKPRPQPCWRWLGSAEELSRLTFTTGLSGSHLLPFQSPQTIIIIKYLVLTTTCPSE